MLLQDKNAHADAVADSADGIDIAVNAVGFLTAMLLKRLPTLEEVANAAAFAASDRASAMTGAIVNLTCGSLVDY